MKKKKRRPNRKISKWPVNVQKKKKYNLITIRKKLFKTTKWQHCRNHQKGAQRGDRLQDQRGSRA